MYNKKFKNIIMCNNIVAIAQTCTEAGKDAGCCVWSATKSCFVPREKCYCDSVCFHFGDCCDDAVKKDCSCKCTAFCYVIILYHKTSN